ncbi:MAG TPA: hypothetical protein ENH30_08400, partial [Nitrospirae bacterium]|nr:hypothetical protein [Nitrospirota bacterium]
MLTGLAIIITGILYILLPHFVMPLEYIKGGRGAMLLSECSIWYHPELYIGILTIIAGISSLKYKKPVIIAALAGFLGIIQAIVLRPVSFYTQSKDPIIILGQTESIRSHLYTREIILILSIVVIILSILHFVLARKAAKPLRITTLTLAYSNLKRRRFRSLALILSLTIVIGAFFSDIFLSKSIESTLEIGAGRLGADLMVVPENEKKAAQAVLLSGGPTIFYLKRDILDGLKALPQIEKISPQLYVQPFSYKVCCVAESILIIAYDPETDFTVGPWIKYALKGNQGPFDIVVGKLVKFYPGQYIDLFGRKLKVAASLDPTGLGYFDNSAFIPMKGARKLLSDLKKREKFHKIPTRQEVLDLSFANLFPAGKENKIKIKDIDPNGISAIFIKAKNNVDVKALSKKIIKKFNGIGVINVRESTLSVKRHLSSMLSAFLLPVIILLAMGT